MLELGHGSTSGSMVRSILGDISVGAQKGMALPRSLSNWGWWQEFGQIGLEASLKGNGAVSGAQSELCSVSLLPGHVPAF